METSQATDQQADGYLCQYAANLLANGNKSGTEIERLLMLKGLDADSANGVVRELEGVIRDRPLIRCKGGRGRVDIWLPSLVASA